MRSTRYPFATILTAVTLVLCLGAPLDAQRVRRNVDSLDEDDVKVLEAAMKAVKALPADNPLSYVFLQDTHNKVSNGPCEHGSEVFLPWHRKLLLDFETALRQSGVEGAEDITLPYWDWSQPPSGQRYPKLAEDPSSEFYNSRRMPPGGPDLPLEDLADAMAVETWPEFGGLPYPGRGYGELERPAHNYMHSSFVAGYMSSDTTAAIDPLFWLFHNGIDYFWWQWQQKFPYADPADPDFKLRGKGFGETTVDDVWKVAVLGYTFQETDVPEKKTLVHEGLAPDVSAAAAAAQPFESYGFDFTVPEPGFQKARLVISNVKTDGASSYTVRYYAHPASVEYSDDPDFQKRYLAATDAHFGSEPDGVAQGHHPPTADVNVNVTKALSKIAEDHAGETWRFTAVYTGVVDLDTGEPEPVLLGKDVDQGVIHLEVVRE